MIFAGQIGRKSQEGGYIIMSAIYSFTVHTESHSQMIDITQQVRQAISESKVKNGIAVIFSSHTTAGITINENADPDVKRDLLYALEKAVPWENGYHHSEGNSAAHLKCSIVGCSQTIIVNNSNPVLGTWQGIYFCEFDGPRTRTVFVKVMEG